MTKPLEIPDDYYPVAQIFTDGNGRFAFYAYDQLTEFLAQHNPKKRMALARELTNKLLLHIVSIAAKIVSGCNN